MINRNNSLDLSASHNGFNNSQNIMLGMDSTNKKNTLNINSITNTNNEKFFLMSEMSKIESL